MCLRDNGTLRVPAGHRVLLTCHRSSSDLQNGKMWSSSTNEDRSLNTCASNLQFHLHTPHHPTINSFSLQRPQSAFFYIYGSCYHQSSAVPLQSSRCNPNLQRGRPTILTCISSLPPNTWSWAPNHLAPYFVSLRINVPLPFCIANGTNTWNWNSLIHTQT